MDRWFQGMYDKMLNNIVFVTKVILLSTIRVCRITFKTTDILNLIMSWYECFRCELSRAACKDATLTISQDMSICPAIVPGMTIG